MLPDNWVGPKYRKMQGVPCCPQPGAVPRVHQHPPDSTIRTGLQGDGENTELVSQFQPHIPTECPPSPHPRLSLICWEGSSPVKRPIASDPSLWCQDWAAHSQGFGSHVKVICDHGRLVARLTWAGNSHHQGFWRGQYNVQSPEVPLSSALRGASARLLSQGSALPGSPS